MNTELISRLRGMSGTRADSDPIFEDAANALEAAQADAQSLGEVILKMDAAKVYAEQERDAALARLVEFEKLSVTNIMLDVVPGWDGMGQEVYAKSVADVEAVLSKMGERLEDYASAGAPPAQPLRELSGEEMRNICREYKGNTIRRLSDHWDEVTTFAQDCVAAARSKP